MCYHKMQGIHYHTSLHWLHTPLLSHLGSYTYELLDFSLCNKDMILHIKPRKTYNIFISLQSLISIKQKTEPLFYNLRGNCSSRFFHQVHRLPWNHSTSRTDKISMNLQNHPHQICYLKTNVIL